MCINEIFSLFGKRYYTISYVLDVIGFWRYCFHTFRMPFFVLEKASVIDWWGLSSTIITEKFWPLRELLFRPQTEAVVSS